eukprot:9786347-Alexandrium_andersonii.AAC.1
MCIRDRCTGAMLGAIGPPLLCGSVPTRRSESAAPPRRFPGRLPPRPRRASSGRHGREEGVDLRPYQRTSGGVPRAAAATGAARR